MDILKVIDLEKSYIDPDTKDHFKAVDGISFEIKPIKYMEYWGQMVQEKPQHLR